MAKTKFTFSHQAGGRYYWTRPVEGARGFVEQVSCSVLWFWGQVTDDTSLPKCDCEAAGSWGATGRMPVDHVLVANKRHQYLAHCKWPLPQRGARV